MTTETVRTRLIDAARAGELVSYRDVAILLGIDPGSAFMGLRVARSLKQICTDEAAAGRPMLSSVVVDARSRLPGAGFFTLGKQLGLTEDNDDAAAFAWRELERTRDYWSRQYGHIARGTRVTSKQELVDLLATWLSGSGDLTIGSDPTFGGPPWIYVCADELEFHIAADTTRGAVERFVKANTPSLCDWRLTRSRTGRLSRVVCIPEAQDAAGWYAYLDRPPAETPGPPHAAAGSKLTTVEAEDRPDDPAVDHQPYLTPLSVPGLLRLYAGVLAELRTRGVLRSSNNPVADYTEWLVARALGLTLLAGSSAGYDATDAANVRYQIKGRRLTPHNSSRQLSAIRGLSPGALDPFDVLVGVLYSFDFTVRRAALVPVAVVRAHATWMPRVNGWRLLLRDSLWTLPNVTDATEQLRAAERQIGVEA